MARSRGLGDVYKRQILDGLAVIRIYARIFMGPNYRTHAEFSNRYF
jgi:hypothetical protein